MIINKELAKIVLIKLMESTVGTKYNKIINKLDFILHKIDMGERYSYQLKYDGMIIPLIGFRIDLETPDIIINTNILQIINNEKVVGHGLKKIFKYKDVLNIIKEYRSNKINDILDS